MNFSGVLPTRFHIGVQKAGSTFLYNLLGSHPSVSLSTKTEIHFYYKYFNEGYEWYDALFPDPGIRIDTSPKYFINGKIVAPRIHESVGTEEARFLLILKNPIDVINSHYLMNLTSGHFANNPDVYPIIPKNVIECVDMYPTYIEQVLYHELLSETWLKYFERKNFHIEILERFKIEDGQRIREIQDFFGLPISDLEVKKISQNKLLRSPAWYQIRGSVIKYPKLKEVLKRSVWVGRIFNHLATVSSKDLISKEHRRELAHRLQCDVENLRVLLGDPLEEWTDF